jgi:hypothetical protein
VTQKYRRVMQHVDLDVMITHFNNVVLNFWWIEVRSRGLKISFPPLSCYWKYSEPRQAVFNWVKFISFVLQNSGVQVLLTIIVLHLTQCPSLRNLTLLQYVNVSTALKFVHISLGINLYTLYAVWLLYIYINVISKAVTTK